MFYYEEKTTANDKWAWRKIDIWDDGRMVGWIERRTAQPGYTPEDRWISTDSISVGYYEREDSMYFDVRSRHIAACKSVSDGKRIFAKWYEEHKDECYAPRKSDMKALPASPDAEFYPTPSLLAGQMAALVDWKRVNTALEPSAGNGDLMEYAIRAAYNLRYSDARLTKPQDLFDCIEIDENLRHILTGKGYKVIHDDFLTLNTQKHYDLILMNPPFSNGDEHLLKAISMQQEHGGQIVCLLNAETIRNPYTNRRKLLASILAEHGATIRMVSGAFSHAQRKSDVEVAIIGLKLPQPVRKSFIMDGLQHAEEKRAENSAEPTALTTGDWVDKLVANYNMEAQAGVKLMEEYNAIAPYIMSGTGVYDKPLIQLSVKGHEVSFCSSDTINTYLQNLRYKYWENMMARPELTSRMTSQMQSNYHDKIRELQDYDFSRHNVERVIREISAQLSQGVEESIEALFETLSAKHAWFPECEKNIHYYNGWATNKAHKVNSKVILPINGFYAYYDGKKEIKSYNFAEKICDIERALSYLDGEGAICRIDPESVCSVSERNQRTSMTFSYFDATFYKKGTCHIKFHPQAQILVDRLNIFAARNRAWLPPTYGKKKYEDMNSEEQAVIDDFQGREAYEQVMKDPSHYITSPGSAIPALTA